MKKSKKITYIFMTIFISSIFICMVYSLEAPIFDNQIDLVSGKWNLISIPKELVDSSVDNLFESSDEIYYKYNGSWTYRLFGTGELIDLEPLKSYWVWVSDNKSLNLTYKDIGSDNPPIPESLDLVVGWNMIGYSGLQDRRIDLALKSIDGKYDLIKKYVGESSTLPEADSEGYLNYNVTGEKDFNKLESGVGYWINITETCTYYEV